MRCLAWISLNSPWSKRLIIYNSPVLSFVGEMLDQVLLLARRPTVMLQYAARRSCATTLKRGRISQWRPPACTQTPCRSRSAGPAAVSDMNVWANPGAQVSSRQQGGVAAVAGRDIDRDDSLLTRTSTSLGRDVGRMVRSGQDSLEPEVCDMQPDFLRHSSFCCSTCARYSSQPVPLHTRAGVEQETFAHLVPGTPRRSVTARLIARMLPPDPFRGHGPSCLACGLAEVVLDVCS